MNRRGPAGRRSRRSLTRYAEPEICPLPGGQDQSRIELRKRMKDRRDAMSCSEVASRSARIGTRVLALSELEQAKAVFAYVSFGNEVQTHELIRQLLERRKTVAVPLVSGPAKIEPHCIESLDDLAPGQYGILVPQRRRPLEGGAEICITPGVAFTERGDRLGYGAAFYDRYLAEHPGTVAIALGYESQLVPELDRQAHDRPVDVLVTESRVIRC